MLAVSYATEQPAYLKIEGLTYGTRTIQDRKVSRTSWNKNDVLASAAVLLAILAAYLYFTG